MKSLLYIFTCWVLLQSAQLSAQNPVPGKKQSRPVLIENATIHIGNGQVIEKGYLAFADGKISHVGATAPSLPNAERIDAAGKHLYPGLILPSSIVGLTEIDAVRATRDFAEVGAYNPHIRSLIAFNTDAEMIPTIRANGVLLVQSTPRGGIISGTSSVMGMDGWNWEDAVHKADDGIHLNWVGFFKREFDMESFTVQRVKNKDKDKELAELSDFFTSAYAYSQMPTPNPKNLKLEAMKGLFDGSKRLYIHADYGREIVEAVQFAQRHQVKNIVIIGATDAWMLVDFLKDNKIPVILNRVHELPGRADDDTDLPYKLPAILHKAGVLVALNYEGDMEAMGSRNLPFTAGTAAAHGLSKEEALQLISANTAKILGIDQRVGTLEVGKDATLLISKGDLLDMRSNHVEQAYLEGKKIDLDNRHKRLYERFEKRYKD